VRLGCDVSVLAERARIEDNKAGYTIYPLKGKLSSASSLFSPDRSMYYSYYSGLFSPDIIFKAAALLRKEIDPDVIFTCGTPFFAMFSAALRHMTGIPSVHYVFEYTGAWRWWRGDLDVMKGYKVPIRHMLKQFLNTAPRELLRRDFLCEWGLKNTQLVASSNYVRSCLFNHVSNEELIPVVYPGVEIPPTSFPSKSDVPIITYLGHLHQNRGVLDLITAFSQIVKHHQQVKLQIANSNVHRLTEHFFNKIVDECNLGSRLIRKGVVKDPYSELFIPSLAVILPYRDSPSMKLLEAMAAARPVITTRIKWTSDLISDGFSGFLVSPGDVKGIAGKIDMLLEDFDLAEEIGKNAREVAKEKCDLDKNGYTLLSILKEATSEWAGL